MPSCQVEYSIFVVAGLGDDGPGIEAGLHLAGNSCQLLIGEDLCPHHSPEVELHRLYSTSQSPPKWGVLSGILSQVVMWVRRCCATAKLVFLELRSLYRSLSWFMAPLKFEPLSLCMVWECPLLETNLTNPAMKAGVVRSDTTSMWMALVVKQMKMQR